MDKVFVILPILFSSLVSSQCPTKKNSGSILKATPPSYVFGIVWSVLYICIGYSWWLIRSHDQNSLFGIKIADALFIVNQLAINLWLYYYNCRNDKRSALYTFLVAIATTIMIIIYGILYLKNQSWWSYMLMVPYLVWLLFAQQLNFHILEK